MSSFIDAIDFISGASIQNLDELLRRIKMRRNVIGIQNTIAFKCGDAVFFDARTKGIIYGKFLTLLRKNAKVQSDDGIIWTVSPHLLRKNSSPVSADVTSNIL